MYQSVPNVASLQFLYKADGQNIQNTYYFHKAAGWSEEELAIIAALGGDWFAATQSPLLPSPIELFSVTATDLTSLDSARFVHVVDPPVPGSAITPMLPLSVTIAIKLGIGKRGRGRQGRIFWPMLGEANVNLDKVDNAYVGDVESALSDLKDSIEGSGAGIEMVVVHRFVNRLRVDPATFDPVLTIGVSDNYVDVQKNRLPFHKKHKPGPVG